MDFSGIPQLQQPNQAGYQPAAVPQQAMIQQYNPQIQNPQPIFNQMAVTGGEQFQRLEHRDQIRLRPDTYIGSPTGVTAENMWTAKIVGKGTVLVECPAVQVAKAIIGICKEMIDNATDNVVRSRTEGIDPGTIDISCTENAFTVRNHGKFIPIIIHHKEGIWVPQMIFGVLLTSDNYNDSIARFKVGRNGYGIKLANIFSVFFRVIVGDPERRLKYTQVWTDGMLQRSEPIIEQYHGPGFTEITIVPDFNYFYENPGSPMSFLDSMNGIYMNRTMEASFAVTVPTTFNGIPLDYRDALTYFRSHFEPKEFPADYLHWKSDDGLQEFVVADTPGKGWIHAFVNGTPVHAGVHVNEYLRSIFEPMIEEFKVKHKKQVTIVHLKKHVSILLRVMLNQPAFDSQIKKKLEKPTPKVNLPVKLTRETVKWKGLTEELKKMFNLKEKKQDVRLRPVRVEKVEEAIQSNSSDPQERLKCTLILTEGETGKTLATKGMTFLPGGKMYNGVLPLRGKTMNVNRHGVDEVKNNKVLSSILQILNADPEIDYHKDPKKCNTLRYGKIGLMMDADYDGFHIDGLLINFVFSRLRSLAPFDFVIIIMTPVIEAIRGGQRMAFFHQKQYAKWMRENDATGWEFKYKKGLGSWNTDPKTLKALFENPPIVTMEVDPNCDDILNLAFNAKLADERKKWISAWNPNSEIVIRTPRPITDFFMEEFRDFSKSAVIRAIPRLMDGLKPVHRKALYALFKKFPLGKKWKYTKVPQIAGSVMEISGYHHGEQALMDAIVGMGQNYVTGPNNLNIVDGEGNFGDRRVRGMDSSPSRYLMIRLHPIAYSLYPKDDQALWKIQIDDGVPVEPVELYPVIPMALVNKCEGIGTGWNCKIYPHDPRIVLEWTRQWVLEKKAKKDVPKDQLIIDVGTKPVLIPWWRDYRGKLVRIKNEPYEAYRNEGSYRHQFHTVFIDEIPAETSIENYTVWGQKQEDLYHEKPEEAILRTFQSYGISPGVDFRVTGMSAPTLEKLNLIRIVSLSRMTLIDKDDIPKTFKYTYEIMCEWCHNRFDIYTQRKALMTKKVEEKLRLTNLKYMFVMDVVEGRLELRGRLRSEIIPYMIAKGYPYGQKKEKKKKGEDDDDDNMTKGEIKAKRDADFLSIPINSVTRDRAEKLRQELEKVRLELEYFQNVWEGDLWLKDLEVLEADINKLYLTPLY